MFLNWSLCTVNHLLLVWSGIVSPSLLMFTGKWKLTYRIAGRRWGGMSEAWSSGFSQGNVTLDQILYLYLPFHISMYCFLNLLWFFIENVTISYFPWCFVWWFFFKMLLGCLYWSLIRVSSCQIYMRPCV